MKFHYWCCNCGHKAETDSDARPRHCDREMKAQGRKDKRADLPHPMQPIEDDGNDVIRFKPNAIVNWMVEQGKAGNKFDLNDIASSPFSREDREQFNQLLGYSVGGFSELSCVRNKTAAAAEKAADVVRERMAKERQR